MKLFTCILLLLTLNSSQINQEDENPALYLGTTFGHYFQILHRLGKYEKMLELTSNQTINHFGAEKLIDFYQNMDFSYPLKLKALNGNTLFYQTIIFGTKKTLKFHFCIENGKCRVIFHKLDPKNPFF